MSRPSTLSYAQRSVQRWHNGHWTSVQDNVAEEVPIALIYNDQSYAVMMASPADLEDFALGFSLSEAVIPHLGELESIDIQHALEGIAINLKVPPERAEIVFRHTRNLIGNSGCGLCGAQTLETVIRHPTQVSAGITISDDALQMAIAKLHDLQPLNAATGATHAAAWVSSLGKILFLREDVGRHNALDKLIGALAKNKISIDQGLLLITSRASYEMVQKAATVGVTCLAAISAPTALAIHLAEATGLTLIGFTRPQNYAVYTHPHRLLSWRKEQQHAK